MEELKPAILTYEDDPQPHLGNGPTWPEFLEAWRDMEAKGWPEVNTEPPPAEITVSKEQQERLKAHIAKMTKVPATVAKVNITSADIVKAVRKRLRKE